MGVGDVLLLEGEAGVGLGAELAAVAQLPVVDLPVAVPHVSAHTVLAVGDRGAVRAGELLPNHLNIE